MKLESELSGFLNFIVAQLFRVASNACLWRASKAKVLRYKSPFG